MASAPAIECLGLGKALFGAQHPAEVFRRVATLVLRTKALLIDGERAAIERLGFVEPVPWPQQASEGAEAEGDFRMLSSADLPRRWRAPGVSGLRLGGAVGVLQQQGQVAEVASDVRMLWAKALLVDGERGASAARLRPSGWFPPAAGIGC